jgi:quinol monooxygenase YgiN
LSERELEELLYFLSEGWRSDAAAHNYREGDRVNAVIVAVQKRLTKVQREAIQKAAVAEYEQSRAAFEQEIEEFDSETGRLQAEILEGLEQQQGEIADMHAR